MRGTTGRQSLGASGPGSPETRPQRGAGVGGAAAGAERL